MNPKAVFTGLSQVPNKNYLTVEWDWDWTI